MVTVYLGENSAGKTRQLKKKIEMYKKKGKFVSTNLLGMEVSLKKRKDIVEKIMGDEGELVIDYEKAYYINGKIRIERRYGVTDSFEEFINIISEGARVLVLDEVESGMSGDEKLAMCRVIDWLKGKFDEVYISTHDPYVASVGERFYFVENDVVRKMDEEEANGVIRRMG